MTADLGSLLKQWRVERGLSLGALALKAGTSKAALSYWEAGKHQPRVAELEAVLEALRASPQQRSAALSLVNAPRAVRLLRRRDAGDHPVSPPVSGDLLRAMRLRRGWPMEQVAAVVGVAASTVSRWERSEAWPTAERLQALCCALGTTAEEVAALTSGVFLPSESGDVPSLETLRERSTTQHRRAVAGDASLLDLHYLTLLHRIWVGALHEPQVRRVQTEILCEYAAALWAVGQYPEARRYAGQALELARRAPATASPERDCVEAALLCAGGPFAAGLVAPGRVAHAVELNRQWLSYVDDPVWESSRYRLIAGYLATENHSEPALDAASRALQAAERAGNPEHVDMCRMTYARVLARA